MSLEQAGEARGWECGGVDAGELRRRGWVQVQGSGSESWACKTAQPGLICGAWLLLEHCGQYGLGVSFVNYHVDVDLHYVRPFCSELVDRFWVVGL